MGDDEKLMETVFANAEDTLQTAILGKERTEADAWQELRDRAVDSGGPEAPDQLGGMEQALVRRETHALTTQLCSQLTKKISAGIIKLLEDRMAMKLSGPDGLSRGMSRIVTESGTSTVGTATAFSIPA